MRQNDSQHLCGTATAPPLSASKADAGTGPLTLSVTSPPNPAAAAPRQLLPTAHVGTYLPTMAWKDF